MEKIKFSDLKFLSNKEIEERILNLETSIFSLQVKKTTKQTIKFHQFKHFKRNLAILKSFLILRLQTL
uniref:Ribosomal protein L29 n=1 Tax=Astrosyne radiata TaxID=1158023 RepID=A0A2U9NT97_9STRA|nr:ribosomal protein L29 [Astrosyne radiata]AWT40357.1 ribosomal protein L29 [Astrosyne radiata]